MPIIFTCPCCNAPLSVPDEYAGQPGPCPRCQATVTIPTISAPAAVAPVDLAAGQPSSKWLVISIVLIALLPILLIVVVGIIGMGFAITLPAIQASRAAARQVECRGNLQRIGSALTRYSDEHGCFPPAYLADDQGTPTHSWRVLILPQLDENDLYSSYDFDEPWDSPGNQALLQMMPDVYGCPSNRIGSNPETSYLMLVGPRTISDGPGTTSMDEITDPKDRTIILVESAGTPTYWMEPTDLNTEEISFRVNDPASQGIQSNHSGGAHVLFADGSVHLLPDTIRPADVEALGTISGDEQIDGMYLDF